MISKHLSAALAAGTLVLSFAAVTCGEAIDVAPHLEKLRNVGPKGTGHREASAAWQALSQAEASQLTDILGGMKGAGRLAENWFRAVVEAVAQRHVKNGGQLPIADLEKFLADTSQSPRARRLAYELIADMDNDAESRLIPPLLNDPSLELRRDAVALALSEADALQNSGQREQAAQAYQVAFAAARSLEQIKAAAKKLRELDRSPNVPLHMGFVMQWNLVGPFDNTDKQGFAAVYPPEKKVDLQASYEGKVGEVSWVEHVSKDEFGIVDLNVVFERPKQGDSYELTDEHKGAVSYAVTTFESDRKRDVDLRIGSVNAHKIWLNGQLLTANEVYHSGMQVDQYVAHGTLQPGRNQILVKICQNEQEDSWAQRWQFQLRVCDHLGTAVLSNNRAGNQTAAR